VGALTERFGSRAVSATGASVALLGTLPFALFGAHGLSIAMVCVFLFVRGVGMSSIGIPSVTAAYSGLPKSTIPIATTSINIAQRFGGPVVTMLLAIFLQYRMKAHVGDTPRAFVATFWVLCAVHIGGIVAALRLPGPRADLEPDPSPGPVHALED